MALRPFAFLFDRTRRNLLSVGTTLLVASCRRPSISPRERTMKAFLRAASIATLLTLPIVLSSCGDGGGGTEPDPQPETLASFQLTVPDSVAEGEAFNLTVKAVGDWPEPDSPHPGDRPS